MVAFRYLKNAISLIYSLLLVSTLILLIFFSENRDYYLKRDLGTTDLSLFATGLIASLVVFVIVFLISRISAVRDFFSDADGRTRLHTILILSLILFISESIVFSRIFFFSDWDPAGVLDCVYKVLHGLEEQVSLDYFSAHPNNLMLVFIYVSVLRLSRIFGTESVTVLIVFQSLLFSLGGVLIFSIIDECISFRAAFFSFILYGFWIGFNPWLVITYSDAVGLIFPLLSIKIFQSMLRLKSPLILPLLLGASAAFGYAVKPQTSIVFIAALILLCAPGLIPVGFRRAVPAVAAFFLFSFVIRSFIFPSLGLNLNSDKAFGFSHYIMMGLNTETDGVYSNDDTEFTNSIADPSERRSENLKVAGDRLKTMGPAGLISHLVNKQLVNFNDGTFSWGIDGNFFAGTEFPGIPSLEDNSLRDTALQFLKPDGSFYGRFIKGEQLIWLTVLFFALLSGLLVLFNRKPDQDRDLVDLLVMLSITGLIIFELLFEAKARYLFTYLPLFLYSAISGICRLRSVKD